MRSLNLCCFLASRGSASPGPGQGFGGTWTLGFPGNRTPHHPGPLPRCWGCLTLARRGGALLQCQRSGGVKQGDWYFKASLGYKMRPCSKTYTKAGGDGSEVKSITPCMLGVYALNPSPREAEAGGSL